jgi:hypothetical protein
MLPACSLVIVAPTGSEEMEMGVVLPIAAMRVEANLAIITVTPVRK